MSLNPDVIGNGTPATAAHLIGNGGFDWTSLIPHFLGGAYHLVDGKAALEAKIAGNPLLYSSFSGEILATPVKLAPTISDLLLIEDVSAFNNKRRIAIGTLPAAVPAAHALGGSQHSASLKTALESKITGGPVLISTFAAEIAAIANKPAPIAADLLLIEDSADTNKKKNVTIGSLPFVAAFNTGFYAYHVGANQVLPALGVETIVDFDSVRDDPGLDFNVLTDTFTAPTTGRYVFWASILISAAAAGSYTIRLKHNGSIVAYSSQQAAAGNLLGLCLSGIEVLAVGDTIQLGSAQNTAVAAAIQGVFRFFGGARIQ